MQCNVCTQLIKQSYNVQLEEFNLVSQSSSLLRIVIKTFQKTQKAFLKCMKLTQLQ